MTVEDALLYLEACIPDYEDLCSAESLDDQNGDTSCFGTLDSFLKSKNKNKRMKLMLSGCSSFEDGLMTASEEMISLYEDAKTKPDADTQKSMASKGDEANNIKNEKSTKAVSADTEESISSKGEKADNLKVLFNSCSYGAV